MRLSFCLGLFGVTLSLAAFAAEKGTAPVEGLRQNNPAVHALVGGRIVIAPGRVLEKGTIVVRDGLIAGVGAELQPPSDARIHDLAGKTIYAGLIDGYNELTDTSEGDDRGSPYWNPQVKPERRVARRFKPSVDDNKKYRGQGIVLRLVAPAQGILKGTSALVDTSDRAAHAVIAAEDVALHFKLSPVGPRGRGADRQYPSSPMGAVALVRQAFYDADWYGRAWEAHRQRPEVPHPERNDALEALQGYAGTTKRVMIDAQDELYFLRADTLAREFRLNAMVRGSGDEYRRLDEIVATGRAVIVPLDFPAPPDVRSPQEARHVTLERLLDWDLAPENAGRLAKAGVKIAFTSHGLKEPNEFLKAVRKSVRRGLSPDAALAALTVTPAELLGVAPQAGTIETGKGAHFVVTDGDLFLTKTKVLETWVAGEPFDVVKKPVVLATGVWDVELQGDKPEKLKLTLKHVDGKWTGELTRGEKKIPLEHVSLDDARLSFSIPGEALGWKGVVRMSGIVSGSALDGSGLWAAGERFLWTGQRRDDAEEPEALPAPPKVAAIQVALALHDAADDKDKPKDDEAEDKPAKVDEDKLPKTALFPVNYPLGAFGVTSLPQRPTLVCFQNATVWTSGPAGTLKNARVIVKDGKIAAVGPDVAIPAGAMLVDLAGKHLTPGVIDCHSHSATDGGINEATQSVTAEVRVGDFIDCDHIEIYRQLAGGVTAINVLHGSANAIGGQNQVLKLRWGAPPEKLKFEGAPSGIKFALGENVKQANWGDKFTTRYPQSRMGVEQIVRDTFRSAQEYQRSWAQWRPGQNRLPPRVDLELEAIAEVLVGKRLIHCHSYRQDEILAFLRTCEEFKVKVGTLQHILEGYKVADVIARHGAGGSAFSDWWAYKIEVYDAIPYNGAVMHQAGVVVSFNSDSAEHARRLNTEATKAVKYGGLSEIDALKFVTLNPARQLGIDGRVGSIEVGKDADLAVWNDSPLSTLAVCEQTWIDGRKYFDRAEDRQRRKEAERMKADLVQRVLASGEKSGDSLKDKLTDLWDREDIFCHHHGHDHDHE